MKKRLLTLIILGSMRSILSVFIIIVLVSSCSHRYTYSDKIKEEIMQTEKAFEKMTAEIGIVEAFYYFADDSAVILREKNTLIKGKDDIRTYYSQKNLKNAKVNWSPDFIDVSDCGTLAYTYGNYVWNIENDEGMITEIEGIFHTVWKKQKDNTWKYVWD